MTRRWVETHASGVHGPLGVGDIVLGPRLPNGVVGYKMTSRHGLAGLTMGSLGAWWGGLRAAGVGAPAPLLCGGGAPVWRHPPHAPKQKSRSKRNPSKLGNCLCQTVT